MPAVHTFAALASIAVAVNFLLQVTVLVAVLTLDAQRQANNQLDVACCFGIEKGEAVEADGIFKDGMLYYFIKNVFAPLLVTTPVRIIVMMAFSIGLCCSICMIPSVNVGISQTIALPSDSYLHNYFGNMSTYLKTGAPVYFVVKDGLNYSNAKEQKKLCSSADCNKNSLVANVFQDSLRSNCSKIALPPFSWIDDYIDWMDPSTPCCRMYPDGTFCPATDKTSKNCTRCIPTKQAGLRPSSEQFRHFLPWFLTDNPNPDCPKGGHAAYGTAVKLNDVTPASNADQLLVNTSHFMAYHTVLTEARDFTDALRWARELSANMSETIGHEVFPYSIFYVFYEQYLTIRDDCWKNLLACLSGVFVVTFLLLGFNIRSAVCVAVTVCMIVVNLMGWMYMWGVSFNAVSLVNLVMSVGISVEFCSHVVRAFSTSDKSTRVERAEDALGKVGSSVLSGITLTKFVGTFVLMFSESKLFVVYYFRMYTGIIVLGALHGIVFLPVLLSYVGPPRWTGNSKEKDVENPAKTATVIANFAALDGVKMSIVEANDDKCFQEMSKYEH
jgi:Niemann-Pick C1 protein